MQDTGKRLAGSEETGRRTSDWTDEEVARLMRLWPDHSNADIAQELNRGENAVAIKASRLHLPSRKRAKKVIEAKSSSRARIRPCLTCGTDFYSDGPGNRICSHCKSSRSWSSGGDYVIGV